MQNGGYNMKKVMIASHGDLANGMKHSIEMIMGKRDDIMCYALYPGHHPDEIFHSIMQDIEQNPDDTYIVMTDLFGGSVCNALMKLVHTRHVHIISGMNLCMLLNICLSISDKPVEDMIETSLQEARKNIIYINDLWMREEEHMYDQDVKD